MAALIQPHTGLQEELHNGAVAQSITRRCYLAQQRMDLVWLQPSPLRGRLPPHQLDAPGGIRLQMMAFYEPRAPGAQSADMSIHCAGRAALCLPEKVAISDEHDGGEMFQGKRATLDLGIPGEKARDGALIAANGASGTVVVRQIVEPLLK